jgi:membrane protease YdiL (CAAX protease family)
MLLAMLSRRVLVLLVGVILLTSGLTVAAIRVVLLEREELEHASAWNSLQSLAGRPGATRISARLTEVKLNAGEEALFELCARDPLLPQRWTNAFDVVVWEPASKTVELRVPLDAPHLAQAKRQSVRACLPLGGGRVKRSGTYAVDAVWANKAPLPAPVQAAELQTRVLARRPLSAREAVLVLCSALGALVSVFSAFAPSSEPVVSRRRTVTWAFAGTALAFALTLLVLRLPIPGSIGGFARGLSLSLIQIGIAVASAYLLYRVPRVGLGLHAPQQRAGLWLFAAVGAALLLRPLSLLAMRVVPATGEAPIEAFISWPSGALAFAALGMAVPLAEELFFRGFVYGALRPLGFAPAFAITTLLFASVHAQQTWGNWGALLSVTLTGAVLTALRAFSGSTLVPAVAHLLYNLSLWTESFGG